MLARKCCHFSLAKRSRRVPYESNRWLLFIKTHRELPLSDITVEILLPKRSLPGVTNRFASGTGHSLSHLARGNSDTLGLSASQKMEQPLPTEFSGDATKTTNTSADYFRPYTVPAETSRHIATILGFPSKTSLASVYYEDACKEIIDLASAISAFEPVRLYARPEDTGKAQSMITQSIVNASGKASNVTIIPLSTNHLWVRDTGPVYVLGRDEHNSRKRFAVNFRFSEWGKKDEIGDHDRASDGLDWPIMTPTQLTENANFAQQVIHSDVFPSQATEVQSKVCLEGGALVIDGDGTLLATESSILNENRNPGLSRDIIEAELQRLLGVKKVIWFPGRKDLDVTDVHADAEVNFIRPGVVVLSRPHPSVPKPWLEVHHEIREILQRSVDSRGRPFEVHMVDEPDPTIFGSLSYSDPATNYVNFYFVNGGLIVPQFGDPLRDSEALATFRRLCPDRIVKPVQVRALPLAGGVIHCATQPVIAVTDE